MGKQKYHWVRPSHRTLPGTIELFIVESQKMTCKLPEPRHLWEGHSFPSRHPSTHRADCPAMDPAAHSSALEEGGANSRRNTTTTTTPVKFDPKSYCNFPSDLPGPTVRHSPGQLGNQGNAQEKTPDQIFETAVNSASVAQQHWQQQSWCVPKLTDPETRKNKHPFPTCQAVPDCALGSCWAAIA